MDKKVLRISLTLSVGLILIFGFYVFFGKAGEIIRFSYDRAMQLTKSAAYLIENDTGCEAVLDKMLECGISADKETKLLKDDERTVWLARYETVADMEEYARIKELLDEALLLDEGSDSVSLGIYDAGSGLFMVIADKLLPPGTVNKPEGWNVSDKITHVAHVRIKELADGRELALVTHFDSDKLYMREYKGMIAALLLSLVFSALCCIILHVNVLEYVKEKEKLKGREYGFYGWKTADVRPELNLYPGIEDPYDLYDRLSAIWCRETCAPRMRDEWSEENKTLGQCSITAFLVQDIFGGIVKGTMTKNGNCHCYNVVGGRVFDLTSEQFQGELPEYSEDDPVQEREEHFAKTEKKERYELLKKRLSEEKGV